MLYLFANFLGLLSAISYPPFGVWPLAWVSGTLIAFVFLKLSDKQNRKKLAWTFASYMFACHLYGAYWIAYTLNEFGGLMWPLAVVATLLLFVAASVPAWFFGYFWSFFATKMSKFFVRVPIFLWLVVWLLLFEWLDYRPFPWTMAQAVGSDTYLMATAAYLGTWGWVAIYVLTTSLIASWMLQFEKWNWRLTGRVAALFAIVFVPAYALGVYRISSLKKIYSARQPVALLQGNVGNYEKRLTKLGMMPTVRNVLAIHRDLIEEAAIYFASLEDEGGQRPEAWVFWPETSFPGSPTHNVDSAEAMRNFVLLTGGLHLVGAYEPGRIRLGQMDKDVDYNILAMFHEDEGFVRRYRKIVRVPFGEYIPGDRFWPQAYEKMPGVAHFGKGEDITLLPHPDPQGPVFVPLICYEILFGSLLRRFLKRAQEEFPNRNLILVNPTNDSWYGPTSELWQHSMLSRWNAARVGLPMLRPTNTGLSQVVAPWGEVLYTGPRNESWLILGQLPVK